MHAKDTQNTHTVPSVGFPNFYQIASNKILSDDIVRHCSFHRVEVYCWYNDWSPSYNSCPSSRGAPRMWAEGEGTGVDWSQRSKSDLG